MRSVLVQLRFLQDTAQLLDLAGRRAIRHKLRMQIEQAGYVGIARIDLRFKNTVLATTLALPSASWSVIRARRSRGHGQRPRLAIETSSMAMTATRSSGTRPRLGHRDRRPCVPGYGPDHCHWQPSMTRLTTTPKEPVGFPESGFAHFAPAHALPLFDTLRKMGRINSSLLCILTVLQEISQSSCMICCRFPVTKRLNAMPASGCRHRLPLWELSPARTGNEGGTSLDMPERNASFSEIIGRQFEALVTGKNADVVFAHFSLRCPTQPACVRYPSTRESASRATLRKQRPAFQSILLWPYLPPGHLEKNGPA